MPVTCPPRRGTKRRKPVKAEEEEEENAVVREAWEGDDLYLSLNADDRMAIDTFLLQVKSQGGLELHGRLPIDEALRQPMLRTLIMASLEQLLLGTGKTRKGFKKSKASLSGSLVQLAPAVFHIPYLKVGRVLAAIVCYD